LRLSHSPVRYDRAPPILGEHTRVVLREVLGLAPERIDDLAARGVI
jgi:formyl-CoA transferase